MTKCSTRPACQQVAQKVGITSTIAELQGNDFHFLTGFFYPKSTSTATWVFRFQFKYSPADATVEEDIAPFGQFVCEPIRGVESSITTPSGRSFCYLPAGAKSEARYGASGLLYKFYLLPPTNSTSVTDVQNLLTDAVDSLQ